MPTFTGRCSPSSVRRPCDRTEEAGVTRPRDGAVRPTRVIRPPDCAHMSCRYGVGQRQDRDSRAGAGRGPGRRPGGRRRRFRRVLLARSRSANALGCAHEGRTGSEGRCRPPQSNARTKRRSLQGGGRRTPCCRRAGVAGRSTRRARPGAEQVSRAAMWGAGWRPPWRFGEGRPRRADPQTVGVRCGHPNSGIYWCCTPSGGRRGGANFTPPIRSSRRPLNYLDWPRPGIVVSGGRKFHRREVVQHGFPEPDAQRAPDRGRGR